MELERSLPCSQEPSTGPYPVQKAPFYLSNIHFNIIF
jgi:hypothetical protein